MPTRPARYCSGPGPAHLTPCALHPARPREPWQGRTSPHARYRSSGGAMQARNARILKRDKDQCQVLLECVGAKATEVDHVIPISEGGGNEDSNLRASCKACNDRLRREAQA